MNKFYILFLFLIFVGLGFYYVLNAGWYPLVIVNGHWIFARELNQEYAVFVNQYQSLLKNRDGRQQIISELRRATLNQLVENALIYEEIAKRLGKNLPAAAENKINSAIPDKNQMAEMVKQLYGLTWADFTALILIPQAHRDILSEQLASEKQEINNWLSEKKRTARVVFLSSKFKWDKEAGVVQR